MMLGALKIFWENLASQQTTVSTIAAILQLVQLKDIEHHKIS